MTNHPRRTAIADAKRAAIAAGWSIREGATVGGSFEGYLGRWYPVHESDDAFRPIGRGHASKGDAWVAAAEEASRDAYLLQQAG